mmetsp:Transcript_36693/g.74915  ORF Transcript_36693/g.74915 Transcript_36693/m.74915 type:complete len:177 (-) Transcript_36693:2188-2718(-)|eukprot:CAMPEP_0113398400 /NCGR_PEP_ID=MMETSP0013_2-20120614/14941_1 /TAXON_ID=2843 ORGANISM="Skeletonema costatum, Strain 1716" /NCGR_SAMPLE_ID=MMETSP0013_2 /ASSEMBLY_ACC=CAM_ASM_000158 /LENGTH=176 /DNA_ID=CAMNT_0000283143 /DNA_START=146 /DNA_END=676 /DNA_ORIENTATION=+ /assembly_acc=CAM_ASM_000158
MKNVVAFLLLLSIPCEILSFSVRPTSVTSRRINAQQNNWVLNAVDQKEATSSEVAQTNGAAAEAEVEEEEELSETKKLLQKVKQAGTAGAISYALWELGFWGVSVPVCVVGYKELTGHWPDFSNAEDMQKVGAEAFAFVNFARLAVPLRIGLALSTTPWIEENVVKKFKKDENTEE